MLRIPSCCLLCLCEGFFQPALAESPIVLRDVTAETGIMFRHTDGSGGNRYVVETVCAGLALFDYDADGDVDIYFLNGGALKGTDFAVPPKNALYRNDGGWRFTDVTDQAGVGHTGHSLGVAVADYDNDGDADLYVTNFGPNVLYRNNGDGTFTDVTARAGVGNGNKVGAGANFLDIDKDGDLDLFVANYVKFSYETRVIVTRKGHHVYAGPGRFSPQQDTLYRNDGNGTFTDVTASSGIGDHVGPGMGTVCGDVDDDGDTDILVANDETGNFLYINDGTGRFEEEGLMAGIAFDVDGRNQGSMGVEMEDYDNDGRLDVHMTSYQRESASLYKNLGDGFLEDATITSRAGANTFSQVTWGNGLVDLDNDGDRDLFIACGHLFDNIGLFDDSSTYHQKNLLLLNDGKGRFTDVSRQSGDGMDVELSSRGVGFDDLDGDGDIDVVILNSRREPTLLRNDSPGKNHWIRVRLRGTKTNRDGVGARVTVVAGDLRQIAEKHSGRGYQSDFAKQLHFGLGSRTAVDRIEVRWIGGGTDVLENPPIDRLITITERTSATK